MKKQLFLAFAFIAMTIGATAQESKTWNFSDLEAGDITETTVFDSLTIHSGTTTSESGETINATWSVDTPSSALTVEGIVCANRLKSGGTSQFNEDGSPIGRVLSFPVSTEGRVRFIAVSSSSGGDDRYVEFAIDEVTVHSYNVPTSSSNASLQTYNYSGNEDTMQVVITGSGGINFYYLDWTDLSNSTEPGDDDDDDDDDDSTSISNATSEKEIVATEYYSVNGIKLNTPVQGINIVKNIMNDGSVEIKKLILNNSKS